MKKLVRKAENYSLQILDDDELTQQEKDNRQVQFTVSISGTPFDKTQMINFAIPRIQNFLNSRYGFLRFDKLSYENFNTENSRINPNIPNTIDFPVTAYFTVG